MKEDCGTEVRNRVPPRRSHAALALFIGAFGLVACLENPAGPDADLLNRTGQAIDVYEVVDGQEQLVVSLDKPLSGSFEDDLFQATRTRPDGCSRGDLVARNNDGVEVARLTETLCIQQTWVIEKDGSSYVDE